MGGEESPMDTVVRMEREREADRVRRTAFYDALNRVASVCVDFLDATDTDTGKQALAGLAVQLNQYAFWVKQGWVDPYGVQVLLMNGRQPGMVMPGERGWPYSLRPDAGRNTMPPSLHRLDV